jgi:hypothetical protein
MLAALVRIDRLVEANLGWIVADDDRALHLLPARRCQPQWEDTLVGKYGRRIPSRFPDP